MNLNRKRLFDIGVTMLSAVVWMPVIVMVAVLIAIIEGPPVFYISRRRTGPEFGVVIKFRTMVKNAAEICNRDTVPISNDVRFLNIPLDSPLYTPIGRFIERCALTELPQLFLVLIGRMSIVGNRPLRKNVIESLKQKSGFDVRIAVMGVAYFGTPAEDRIRLVEQQ